MNQPPIGLDPVRVPESRGIADALRLTLYILVLSLPFLLYVALSVRQVVAEYRLSSLVKQRRVLAREQAGLALQRDYLLSPSRVDHASTALLAMVPEDPDEPVLPAEGLR